MVLDNSNVNLTAAQKELLKWHFCLGHLNMRWIQRLVAKKILDVHESNVTSKNAICNCMACSLAKQTRSPEGTVQHTIRKSKDGNLKKGNLRPGAMVSSDQFVSSLPGRLPSSYGREKESEKYVGGTIFIDEASGYFSVHNQVSLNAEETIRSKHSFERDAIRHGVPILGYRADNGIYRSAKFREDLNKFGQTIQFCGVGAHHHNGMAERGIRTISTAARAMLIHAMIHWPDNISLDLWPFAIKYAVYIWNRIPNDSELSPLELFYNTKSDHQQLRASKFWGCPAYVLDPRIQDGKKIPRWNPRSKLGQFLGRSDEHASSVGLIRNLKTNAVSAQFHVVYDNHFSTMSSSLNEDNVAVPANFHNLYTFSRENHYDPDEFIRTRRAQLFNPDRDNSRSTSENVETTATSNSPSSHITREEDNQQREMSRPRNLTTTPLTRAPAPDPTPPLTSTEAIDSDSETVRVPRQSIDTIPDLPSGATRSGKRFRSENDLSFVIGLADNLCPHDAFLAESDLDSKSSTMTRQYDAYSIFQTLDSDENITTNIHPLAFAARANAEDTPRYHEAMKSPDREGFITAMEHEMNQLGELKAFIAVPRQKAIDENKQIIDCTWAFKRKRFPDGTVKKLKARLCVRGDLQETNDAFDTYSPVVQWSTVRLLLVLSIILRLETKQIDFTLAFVQADAEPGTYIEMPPMFSMDGYILELKKNLYGQKDAPIKFYQHMCEGFRERGFKASSFDPCLFISKDAVILSYVDDCILINRSKTEIDSLIDSLKTGKLKNGKLGKKYLLDVEGDYAGFLGIDILKVDDGKGSLEFLQTGLIDRILNTLSLNDKTTTVRSVPAGTTPLGKDEHGPPRKEFWSYPSVIGMMLYLASNSRPDIAFAVNQCERFNSCPKLIHEKAVKRIARYLKATRERGLILQPSKDLSLKLYADADFAGLWKIEKPDDPISVRSRTGFIITLSDIPVSWSSKLQTEIATSTMMSEYVALSTGMRELIPTMNIFKEICDAFHIKRSEESQLVRIFEDNEGAKKLAEKVLPRTTPQSKHFGGKYHWFRSHVTNPASKIKIYSIDTSLQKADIFTKGLVKVDFEKKRYLLMGW